MFEFSLHRTWRCYIHSRSAHNSRTSLCRRASCPCGFSRTLWPRPIEIVSISALVECARQKIGLKAKPAKVHGVSVNVSILYIEFRTWVVLIDWMCWALFPETLGITFILLLLSLCFSVYLSSSWNLFSALLCNISFDSTRKVLQRQSGNVHFSLPTFLRSQFSSRSLSGHVVYAACVPRSHPLIFFKLTSRSKKIGHPTSQLCFYPFSSFKRCAQSQRMSHLFPSEFLTQILVRICCLVYT